MANPAIYNTALLTQAGINPAAVIPAKRLTKEGGGVGFKSENRRLLRIIDEQDAVRRYTWDGLPNELSGELIERILYYRGSGALFFMEADEKFYFLPYALDGTIDCYGRFTGITPLPFGAAVSTTSDGKEKPWIKGLHKVPRYDLKLDEVVWEDITDSCVLLHDYTPQLSQTLVPRQQLNDGLLDVMAEMIPFMRTALLNSTGVKGVRVDGEQDASNVLAANNSITNAALVGQWAIPIVGQIDFQELSNSGSLGKSEEFMLALQSLDSYRLSTYGLPSGGLFQKKAHMLEAEQSALTGTSSLVLQDGLALRQNFAQIANSYYGLNVSVNINESITGVDADLDGDLYGGNAMDADDAEGEAAMTMGGDFYDTI